MRSARQRLDKWLWFARFARTRTSAGGLVRDGFVRVNGKRVEDPAKAIAVGDVVTVAAAHGTATVRVVDCGERRGPGPEARALYADFCDLAKELGST